MAYDGLLKRFSRYNGRGVTQREYIDWIQQAREKACTKANISSAFTATGLIPFNPNRVLGQLKVKKDYDRPITPPDYPQQAPPQLITTPDQIQQGTITLQIAGKDAEALIDQITKATPSQANHVATLKAVIQFHRAKNAVLSQQVQSFQSARANDKPRKKTKVKGSAKVYTKEEVNAIQAAIKEKQRLKNI
jgi:hypothetical protein